MSEVVHAHWIQVDETKCRCSNCDIIALIGLYPHGDKNYCPNCGAMMDERRKSVNWLEKTEESYNSYFKTYRAGWCSKSGLPMTDSSCWERIRAEDWYTVSRAKKKHVSIDMTQVCAWYRVWHGYMPMFKANRQRSEIKDD